jgi:hypothetical protein
MVKESFSKTVMDLYSYFRFSKLPSERQIDLWYDEVDFIPEMAMDWIFKELKTEDSVPRNLPKAFMSQWYSYRKANPDKSTTEFEYCEDCFGHGTHMFEKLETVYNPPMWKSNIVICSLCNNWKKQFGSVARNGGKLYIERKPIGGFVPKVPSTTRQEIEDLGFKYLPQSNSRAPNYLGEIPTVDFNEV